MSNPTELPDLDALLADYGNAAGRYTVLGDVGSHYNDMVGARNAIRDLFARRAQPEGESIPIPTSVNMARLMLGLSYSWLKEHAPEHVPNPQPEGEAPQAVAARMIATRAMCQAGVAEANRRDCFIDQSDAEMIFEAMLASAPAATLSPLCGAQHAESGKEAIGVAVEWANGKVDLVRGAPKPDSLKYWQSCGAKVTPIGPLAAQQAAARDPVVEANRQMLLDRSNVGIDKYGVTLGDANLAAPALVQHALEEALDLANYLQALLRKLP